MCATGPPCGLFIVVVREGWQRDPGNLGLSVAGGVDLDNSRLHQQIKEECLDHLRGLGVRNNKPRLAFCSTHPTGIDGALLIQQNNCRQLEWTLVA